MPEVGVDLFYGDKKYMKTQVMKINDEKTIVVTVYTNGHSFNLYMTPEQFSEYKEVINNA